MAFYGVVGPGVYKIFTAWKDVEEMVRIYPYCKYRRFSKEEHCWDFIYRYKRSRSTISLSHYGDTFDNCYAQMSYVIQPTEVYINYNTTHLGLVRIAYAENRLVEYKANYIMVKEKSAVELNDKLIYDHLLIIARGIDLLGEYIDVDIIVPDHSIYYALTAYTGTDMKIRYIQEKIKQRIAEYSITVLDDGGAYA